MTLLVLFFRGWRLWERFKGVYMLKSWGGRYGVWLGLGWQSQRTRLVERSWLRTVWPPYLRGQGLSVALGLFSVRGGLYRRIGDYTEFDEIEDVDGELAALGWGSLDDKEEEIAAWA